MRQNWQRAYLHLQEYVDANRDIQINNDLVVIPENLKKEFYRLFDTVRITFIQETCQPLLSRIEYLNSNYEIARQEIIRMLDLEGFITSTHFSNFSSEFKKRIKGELFTLLFNLLQEELTSEGFGQKAISFAETSYSELYETGYVQWLVLSLFSMLQADKIYQVNLPAHDSTSSLIREDWGQRRSIPLPKIARVLSFMHASGMVLAVPDFIVHSTKLQRFVSFRTKFGPSTFIADRYSTEREWYLVNAYPPEAAMVAFKPSLLVYIDNNLENLSLIADHERICRPEVIIEYLPQREGRNNERLDRIWLQYEKIRPKIGTYLITREPILNKEIHEGICGLNIGFVRHRLEPIVNALQNV